MASIVLGTDFSDASTGAAEIAVALARRLGDGVLLTHVVEPTSYLPIEAAVELSAVRTGIWEQATRQLKASADELRAQDVDVEERLISGAPDEMLVQVAQQAKARLIVVGTHGRGTVGRLLFGSVAQRVLQFADRPVILASAGPGRRREGWSSRNRPLRVAVALDPSRPSLAAVEWVRQLRAQIPCDVIALHAYRPLGPALSYGLFTPEEVDQPTIGLQFLERDMRQLLGSFPGEGEVELRLEPAGEHPGAVVARAALEREVDLLVMGTHRRRGDGHRRGPSTAEVAVHAGAVPVVAVPAEAPAPSEQPATSIRSALVATDLSDSGNRIVPLAFGLVNVPGGVVHLCHVLGETSPAAEEIAARLLALVPCDAAVRSIAARVEPPAGDPRLVIPELANRLDVQLVCLSSAKSKIGRVAQNVIRGARRPVLVMPVGD